MKKHVKILLALAVLSLLPASLSAQEKTLEVQLQKENGSIIREIGGGPWLVSSYHFGQSVFSWVDESLSTASQLLLGQITGTDSMKVNDFEIFRDTVYFCGQVWREREISAFWGYFPLSGFPNVNVSYSKVGINGFSGIDVFSVDTTTIDLHVVMIGESTIGFEPLVYECGYIYDEVRVAPNTFEQYISSVDDIYTNGTAFYDVEATDTNVAVSSEIMNGSVLFFDKPTTVATTIFDYSVMGYPVTNEQSSFIKLEYCKNNALVAVYRNVVHYSGPGIPTSSTLHVRSFIDAIPHARLEISGEMRNSYLDVKFDTASNDLDIMVSPTYFFLSRAGDSSMIFHLNPSLVYNGGSVFCHKYSNERLFSLEWISGEQDYFVASGRDVTQHNLRIYKYNYTQWEPCTEQEKRETIKLDAKTYPVYTNMTIDMVVVEMLDLKSFDLEKTLKVVCE